MSAITTKTVQQPDSFAFTAENVKIAEAYIAKYPAGREQSAVMPLLTLAQKQHQNWLPVKAIELVAKMCNMPYIRAYEVASFYTMYNLAPVGRHLVQCCTTTPCWLRGSDEVVKACKDTLGIGFGETTRDGMFTLTEVECLGACVNAPMVQVDGHDGSEIFYEDLDYASTREILLQLKRNEKPKVGPQTARTSSEPLPGLTSLTTIKAG
ncbi:MAG: NADH-quinone oxidoreductase subunit NuoE [Rickettsiales bacterium]